MQKKFIPISHVLPIPITLPSSLMPSRISLSKTTWKTVDCFRKSTCEDKNLTKNHQPNLCIFAKYSVCTLYFTKNTPTYLTHNNSLFFIPIEIFKGYTKQKRLLPFFHEKKLKKQFYNTFWKDVAAAFNFLYRYYLVWKCIVFWVFWWMNVAK